MAAAGGGSAFMAAAFTHRTGAIPMTRAIPMAPRILMPPPILIPIIPMRIRRRYRRLCRPRFMRRRRRPPQWHHPAPLHPVSGITARRPSRTTLTSPRAKSPGTGTDQAAAITTRADFVISGPDDARGRRRSIRRGSRLCNRRGNSPRNAGTASRSPARRSPAAPESAAPFAEGAGRARPKRPIVKPQPDASIRALITSAEATCRGGRRGVE